jgi:hypothetical protein
MRSIYLLPTAFLKIGLGMLFLSLTALIIHHTWFPIFLFNGSNSEEMLSSFGTLVQFHDEFFYGTLTLGLLFAGFSKTKIEDERSLEIRRKSAFFAVFCSLIWMTITFALAFFSEGLLVYQFGIVMVLLPLVLYCFALFIQLQKNSNNDDQ